MSLLTTLYTGTTGLRIASTGISVVGHNVANSATEGYSQRDLATYTKDPLARFGLEYGQGVATSGMNRAADSLINQQLVSALGSEARSTAGYTSLTAIEAYFDESIDGTIAGYLDTFFDSLNELATDPSDYSLRQGAVSAANNLSVGMNTVSDGLQDHLDGILEDLQGTATEVQDAIDEVAVLNGQIIASGANPGSSDYADRVNQLVNQLGEQLGVQADFSSNGTVTLFLGGHAIVSGAESRDLSVTTDATGAPQINLSADNASLDVTALIGGAFGGSLDAADAMDGYLTDLDTFVNDFITTFNTQHQAGFDQAGTTGLDFFDAAGLTAAGMAVDANLLGDVSLMATAGAATAEPGDSVTLDALIALEDDPTVIGGAQSPRDFLATLYTDVGNTIRQLELETESNLMMVEDITALRDSVSAVDLDEQAVELVTWQAHYEASARVISAANSMLAELIDMVG